MISEIKVVVIYAPADEPLWQALKVFISAMQRQGLLNIILWDPGELSPGIDKEKALDHWINEAHLVLLLLSSNLLIMDIYHSISSQLLLQNEQDRTRILPILLRPLSWKETPWGKLSALPNRVVVAPNVCSPFMLDSATIQGKKGTKNTPECLLENGNVHPKLM